MMDYFFHLLIYFAVYVVLAQSLNLILGYAGMFSLAHAAFFAVGAYSYAVLTVVYDWGFAAATLSGVILGGVLSLLISIPSWRLKGDDLLMVTMAAQVVVFSAIYNWHDLNRPLGSLGNLTNGPYGIMDVPEPTLFSWQAGTIGQVAAVAVLAGVLVVLTLSLLQVSPWGRLLRAIRDDELAARNLGKNTRLAKVQALGIGGGLAAVAGAVYASYSGYVDPSLCSITESVLLLAMVLVGGSGLLLGPFLGAALLIGIPEILRFLAFPPSVAGNARLLVFGLLLVLLTHLSPKGIAGLLPAQVGRGRRSEPDDV